MKTRPALFLKKLALRHSTSVKMGKKRPGIAFSCRLGRRWRQSTIENHQSKIDLFLPLNLRINYPSRSGIPCLGPRT